MEETICLICGDKGADNALVFCVQCVKYAVHRYCLDEVTIDEYVHWVCGNDCEGLLPSNSSAHECNVVLVQTRDSSNSEVRERISGAERNNDDVVIVNTEHNIGNLDEQSHDACIKIDSVVSPESNEDLLCSHLVETNKKDRPSAVEERKSSEESLREMLQNEKPPEEIFLKDIWKMKKKKDMNKSRSERPANEDDYRTPVDISAGKLLKKHEDMEIPCEIEKQNSKLRDKRSVSEKSNKSDKDLSTRKRPVSSCKGSSKGSKKQRTDSSKSVVSKSKIIKKIADQSIQGNLRLELDNQCNEVSDQVTHSDPYNDDDGKIIPVKGQEKDSETNTMVNYGDDFREDLEIRVAQPLVIPIWSGGLHISNKQHSVHGLVAHMSNKGCQKVYETACELQPVIECEMLPRVEVWPKSFETCEPNGESIALYVFASAISARVFDELVWEMVRKELALKAVLRDAELLIFTSTELPFMYWRFQGNFYLWGVFRGKRRAPSESGSCGFGIQDKSTISTDG